MKHFLMLISSLAIAIGCTSRTETSSDKLMALARQKGDSISMMAKAALGSQLKAAIQEGGPAYAVEFCNVAAYPILDSLPAKASIRRASLRIRNPKDAPTDTEKEILQYYESRLSSEELLEPQVRETGNNILYARPILLDNPLCLNCHGSPGTHIQEETMAKLDQLYPEDNAKNHALGDLRGIWSISFDRDELVSYLDNMEK